MRQTHVAGEKVFVDFAGDTADVVDPRTGEVRAVKLFVAALGASNYTYPEAVASEGLEDWIGAHVRMFAFLGGVPKVVVPDNLKSAVFKADRFIRPGSCTCRKITSCSAPCRARQARIRRSRVRRTPGDRSGWRRNISSKMDTSKNLAVLR